MNTRTKLYVWIVFHRFTYKILWGFSLCINRAAKLRKISIEFYGWKKRREKKTAYIGNPYFRWALPVDDITLFCVAGASMSICYWCHVCFANIHSSAIIIYSHERTESKHIPTERYDSTKESTRIEKKLLFVLLQRTMCASVYDRIGSYHQMSVASRTPIPKHPLHYMCEYILMSS